MDQLHNFSNSIESRQQYSQVMTYQNEHVIDKFTESFDVSRDESAAIFEEMKKLLWLMYSASQESGPEIYVHKEILVIDEMWHTFILFTQDYDAFCRQFFGEFLHHSPTTLSEKEKMKRDYENAQSSFVSARKAELEAQYSYVYDVLGEKTLLKWYQEYPEVYSEQNLKNLRKY
ncbi:hypothetical protein A7985_00960 [Pseudoalteromonas luteoviolacea]|uniref:Uncharacterized protein n=1 Tax=Pseudoalteromonas luteoviolacea TaxID=43657 RepID=A0A1C0TTB3_9GAMM|nr:hypothetical protein [Pseudoalteromonas luteoviolacea]MBQ4811065.1 hypothetical protein [Pseudoalteromonas luteoviolacea]OCQ22568.1 hypothetical protein A7985_00960 [Pseudoalteromonas luteoviolacea]